MTTDSMYDPESKLFIMWSFTDFQLASLTGTGLYGTKSSVQTKQ